MQKGKHFLYTKADINRIEKEAYEKGFNNALILVMAYRMEDEDVKCDEDKLISMFEKIQEWGEHIATHMLSIKKIIELIKEYTGITIKL